MRDTSPLARAVRALAAREKDPAVKQWLERLGREDRAKAKRRRPAAGA